MKKTAKQMVEEALALVKTCSLQEALELHGREEVQFIDLRDIRELERDGTIPGAFHAPRGMLEFWVDPESPYHKPLFAQPKQFVLFCAGGWRSALAARTLLEMGLDQVAHIDGGFKRWKEGGGPVGTLPPRR
ncbi:rhodanese-like domain-containing protein [Azohydromonas caseinilytica]|uniref:Rhodanese-like domain-containing protein n=1 Tax=Azohydromonas caseinilytica TaxID=2728836 RepID=A0A848FA36_9BURK|nr:rhodanese-like domain-containing protein [Azohydromonas caseinilytica]NML15319.1 rhodanese-like domain-containing protein [Azohydromonas caseinilytica]